MKRKLISVLLILCMVLTQFGATVFASEETRTAPKLESLTVGGQTFDPASGTSFSLSSEVNAATVTVAAASSQGTVTGAGDISLNYGSNTLTVTVTAAEDSPTYIGSTSYTIAVTRTDNRSTDATLSSITVGGTAISGFASGTLSYKVTLAATVTSTEVVATTTDGKATVTGGGTKKLEYGTNTVKLIVTAEKGNTQTYTVVITRTDNRSSDNNLKELTVSDATFTFNKATTSYTVAVATTVTSVKIVAVVNDSKATVSGDFGTKTLSYGTNTFKIVVTAENGDTKTYTLNVSRPDTRSVNNYLATLGVSGTTLDFVQTTTDYTVIVPNATASVELTATAADATSKLTGVGTKDLSVYDNTFSVVVTAENGETRTYKVKVIRRDEQGKVSSSSTALHRLTELSIEGVDFTFSPDVYEYAIDIDNSITALNFTATPEDSKDTWSAAAQELIIGENTVVVSVLNNGALVNCYTFVATRDYPYVTFDSLARRLEKLDGNTVAIEIHDDNNVMTAAMLEQLKTSGKTATISKFDDSGKLLYTWTINGASISGAATDFNTLVSFSSLHKDQIDGLTNNKGCVYLDFAQSGSLPAGTTVKVYVGDRYADGEAAYVYYFNPETSKLELIAEDLTVSGGYVTFSLDHASEYVVTNYKTGAGGLLIVLIAAAALVAAGVVVFILMKKGVIQLGGGSRRRRSHKKGRKKSSARRR